MKNAILGVFVFLSGVCLGLLLKGENPTKRPQIGGRDHTFIIQRVMEIPEWGPILADHGKTTFYFASDEGFSSATAGVYSTLTSKVSEVK